MKKSILSLVFGGLGLVTFAQQSIPNGNFENWTSTSYQNPKYYESSNSETYQSGLAANCEKVTGAFHGASAIKLSTVVDDGDDYPGFIINADPDGDPGDWHGGFPVSGTPTGIRGYYQSDVQSGDTAYIIVAFSKNGVNIGTYSYQFYGTHNTYTLFDFTLSPALAQAPDSVVLAAISSDVFNDNFADGSMLQLDSISLSGLTTQPAELNGDFEEWEAVTSNNLTSWYVEMDDQNDVKTTDAYRGSFATRIETEMGDNDGIPHAYAGQLSTGFYPQNCNNCTQQGGFPFNRQNDTIVFWYKYTPAGGSKAVVYANTKAAGIMLGGNMMELNAAATYTMVKMPISSMSVPDSLIVNFQSSRWEDSLETQVGAVLIIDEVQLVSQPLHTGLFTSKRVSETISVSPNPATTSVVFNGSKSIGATYRIINITGQEVATGTIQSANQSVDISTLQSGLYFYSITYHNELLTTGKLRVE